MAPSLERRVAIDAARAAGRLLHAEFRAAHRVAFKGQTTNLVTEMDERAEELIVGRLASAFPDDTILAEERGAAPGRSGRRWVVGPLDGTTNYAHGLAVFSVSIALEVDRRIALGVAYDPSVDELYVVDDESGGEPARDGLPVQHPRDRRHESGRVRGLRASLPRRASIRLRRPRSRVGRRRSTRRLVGAPPRRVGRRRRRPLRRAGRRTDHESGVRLRGSRRPRGGRE